MHHTFKRLARRALLCLTFLLAGCGAASDDAAACPSVPGPISDSIVLEIANNLATLPETGGQPRPLTTFPLNVRASNPAWSPDGATLAFTVISLAQQGRELIEHGHHICGLDRQTGQGRELVARVPRTTVLDEVAWTPDSRALLMLRYEQDGINEIVRHELATGKDETVLAPQAALVRSPIVAPDGTRVAYIQIDRGDDGPMPLLMIAQSNGQQPQPITPSSPAFALIAAPRWSPDGRQILFTAARTASATATAPDRSLLDSLAGVGASVARAHEIKADLWLVDADGQHLRQLVKDLNDPRAAWSADGRRIVYASGEGVAIVDLLSGQTQPISSQGGHAITWAAK
ncbi:MAG TPA: hypothetical protein VFZ66_17870 [Herpetosiphonaceae bacterium]